MLFEQILFLVQTYVDVKQTYSWFHRNFNTTIGIIAVDVLSATLTGRLKCNKATFLFSSSFGEYS
ncbi:enolase [Morococcus cerebrosus]|uniref:Enolase n=1 Tax=Morococcus cerebrosus TaxID=1056807 RepID=A0A0C1ECI2_9NEIS|nr:enolase [Morococcus cerebrosus]